MAASGYETTAVGASRKRTRLTRTYPVHTLEEALAVPTAVYEANSGLPFDRVLLARELDTTPSSSAFTMKLSSSARYGLTKGGAGEERVSLTGLGESLVGPQDPNERRRALVEVSLKPEPFRRFYEMLDGKKVPDDSYAENVLRRELSLQPELTAECLRIIKKNGLLTGIITDVAGSLYVRLSASRSAQDVAPPPPAASTAPRRDDASTPPAAEPGPPPDQGAVFIGHAGAEDVAQTVKGILSSFGIPSVQAEADPDDGFLVSPRTIESMRGCAAAVIIFAEARSGSWAGLGLRLVTPKILAQLGAAAALYGDRVVPMNESGFDSDIQWDGLGFHRERVHEMGLQLLGQLHKLGVIQVRVGA